MASKEAIEKADEQLLAELGYKQEFKRAFTPIEVIRDHSLHPRLTESHP